MSIVTKRGDEGETGLLYGGRVSKADPRCEAYGTIDEAVSALGLARSFVQDKELAGILLKIQRELFTVGAELATDDKYYNRLLEHFSVVTPEMVKGLEDLIARFEPQLTIPKGFVIPGASLASAAIDLARSTVRRGERRAVELKEKKLIRNNEILRYLNRLGDLLWILARYVDRYLPPEMLTGDASR